MNPSSEHSQLLHRTTMALTQLHRLLQQATDILANLHSLFLLHTGEVDAHFQRSFTVPIPSPTSSCDTPPIEPIKRAPRKPTASQDSSSSTPPPQPPQPKKRRDPPPPPPLNPNADWDAWDSDADIRLVELKTDIRLRPNWNYVARRVGFSIDTLQQISRTPHLHLLQHHPQQLPPQQPRSNSEDSHPEPLDDQCLGSYFV